MLRQQQRQQHLQQQEDNNVVITSPNEEEKDHYDDTSIQARINAIRHGNNNIDNTVVICDLGLGFVFRSVVVYSIVVGVPFVVVFMILFFCAESCCFFY